MTAAIFAALALALRPAPPPVCAADLDHFPPPAIVKANLEFADAHLTFLVQRAATHGWGHGLREWYEEAVWCRRCWSALDDAQRHDFSAAIWWHDGDQLRWLRGQIGGPAYQQGRMPPPAPYARFNQQD